jgi:hypothetical protein
MDGIIDLPDRFEAVRDYQVVGHDGNPIAFALASEQGKTSKLEGPRTWKEQLEDYEYRLWKLDEYRKIGRSRPKDDSLKQEQLWAGVTLGFSPFGLSQPSIPIWGQIGSAIIHRTVRGGQDWSLTFVDGRRRSITGTNRSMGIDAFPDVEPKDGLGASDTDFLVLAMNKVYGEVLPPHEVNMKKLAGTYSGIGLLIEHVGTPGEFYRRGAFRSNRLPLKQVQESFYTDASKFGIQGEYDGEKGHKLWLI